MVVGFVEYSRMALLSPNLISRPARVPNVKIIAISKVFVNHMFSGIRASKVTVVNHCPCQTTENRLNHVEELGFGWQRNEFDNWRFVMLCPLVQKLYVRVQCFRHMP